MTSTAGSSIRCSVRSSRSISASPRGSPLTRPASPPATPSSASTTEAQNRCPSRSSCATVAHAVRRARPASATHERSSQVFPLPAGADTIVTRPAAGEPLEQVAPRDQRLVAAARPRAGGLGRGVGAGEQRHDLRAAAGRRGWCPRIRRRCGVACVLADAREGVHAVRVAGGRDAAKIPRPAGARTYRFPGPGRTAYRSSAMSGLPYPDLRPPCRRAVRAALAARVIAAPITQTVRWTVTLGAGAVLAMREVLGSASR